MNDLQKFSNKLRLHVLKMINNGKSSHIASSFSMADIIGTLYGSVMNFDVKNPKWEGRDRFILSKGHAGACVYAALAESGFFSTDLLMGHYQNGSKFSGHVSHIGVPGVEFSTGSLGHGLPVGVGMAMAAKRDEKKHRVFVVLSDGECDEGSNWEAFMFAAHHKLNNLVVVIDYNKIQSLASVEDTLGLEPFKSKLEAFNWRVVEADGHDHAQLEKVLDVKAGEFDKPTVVLAHTTKGKGVSFMENTVLWHYRSPQDEEYDNALKELEALV